MMLQLTEKELAVLQYLYKYCPTPDRYGGISVDREWGKSSSEAVRKLAHEMREFNIGSCRDFWDLVINLQGNGLAHLETDGRTAYILPRGQQEIRRRRSNRPLDNSIGRNAKVDKLRILFLAADPRGSQLQLDVEAREIDAKIRASEFRDSLEFITRWAVRPDDVQQNLLEVRPHILHFSGHGTPGDEIVLVDDHGNQKPVSGEALNHLLSVLKDNIQLVVLNACYSRAQAEAIVQCIDCAVGMGTTFGDEAAILFAGAFYRALGFGRTIKEAYELGVSSLKLHGIPEDKTPELLFRPGMDVADLRLIEDCDATMTGSDTVQQPGTVDGASDAEHTFGKERPVDVTATPSTETPADGDKDDKLEPRFFWIGVALLAVSCLFAAAVFVIGHPTLAQWLIFKAFFSPAIGFSAWCFAGRMQVGGKRLFGGLDIKATAGFAAFVLALLLPNPDAPDHPVARPEWTPDDWSVFYDDAFLDQYTQLIDDMNPEAQRRMKAWKSAYRHLQLLGDEYRKRGRRVLIAVSDQRSVDWPAHVAKIRTTASADIESLEAARVRVGSPTENPTVSVITREKLSSGDRLLQIPALVPGDIVWIVLVLRAEEAVFPPDGSQIPFDLKVQS